jgi:DNA-binding XRE family transcriptional regulator
LETQKKNTDWSTPHGRLAFVLPETLSQGEMADQLDVSRGTWSACLLGKQLPSLKVYMRIVELTGANLDWLIYGNGLPYGGIDFQRFKRAASDTLKIAVQAAVEGDPQSESVVLNTFLTFYQREMAAEAEHLRKYGYGTYLKPEATNDQNTLSDGGRKKVP